MRTVTALVVLAFVAAVLPAATAGGKDTDAKTYKVKVVADLPYFDGKDADEERNKLDLYLPEGTKDFPVLFFIHGGGWTKGDRKKFDKLGRPAIACRRPSGTRPTPRTSPGRSPGRTGTSASTAATAGRSSSAATRRAGTWRRCWPPTRRTSSSTLWA
jgi:hypothetical protein